MQQQSNLTQLQLELHRLTRSQSQIKPSFLPTDGNFHGPLLSHPENTGLNFPAVTAHLLQGTAGFPPSVEPISRQVNFTGTNNSPQVLGNSLVSPQTLSANWSLNTVPNVHQCSRDATFSNIGNGHFIFVYYSLLCDSISTNCVAITLLKISRIMPYHDCSIVLDSSNAYC